MRRQLKRIRFLVPEEQLALPLDYSLSERDALSRKSRTDHDVYGEDAQMMEGMTMPAVLEGKIALVTGVSHDGQIGQAVAENWQRAAPRSRFAHVHRATWKRARRSYAKP